MSSKEIDAFTSAKKKYMRLIKSTAGIVAVLVFVCCLSSQSQAQDEMWKTLGKLSWTNTYDEDLDLDITLPVFGQEIKALEGKEITIKGYIIPVDTDGTYSVLSAFPYNNCFFCGGAGPETVMEIDLKQDRKLLNKHVVLKGKLKLNSDDFYQLIYRLVDVKLISKE